MNPEIDTVVYFDPDRPTYYLARFGERGCYRWPAHIDGWQQRTALRATAPWTGLVELDGWHAALALALTRDRADGAVGESPCAVCLGPTDRLPVLLANVAVCDECLVRDSRPAVPAAAEPSDGREG